MGITPRWGQPVDDIDLKRKVALLEREIQNLTKQLELINVTTDEGGGDTTGALVHGNNLHSPHMALKSEHDAHVAATDTNHTLRGLADYSEGAPPDVGQAPVWNGAMWEPGATIPAPSLPGQVFMSVDGATYAWEVPVTSEDGWLISDDGTMLVEG
jgi:hypothetical protein